MQEDRVWLPLGNHNQVILCVALVSSSLLLHVYCCSWLLMCSWIDCRLCSQIAYWLCFGFSCWLCSRFVVLSVNKLCSKSLGILWFGLMLGPTTRAANIVRDQAAPSTATVILISRCLKLGWEAQWEVHCFPCLKMIHQDILYFL